MDWLDLIAVQGTLKNLLQHHSLKASVLQHLAFFGSEGKASAFNAGRSGFDPWVRKILWRRKWQPTPVPLPGKSHRRRSPAGYSPWGHKELDMTKQLNKNKDSPQAKSLQLTKISDVGIFLQQLLFN